METLTENLYERIIEKNANIFSGIRIISGYSSAKFLEKVITDFPKLKIELYIGMSLEGISKQNHKVYKQLQQNHDVQVFYQIEAPKNHMKIIEFFNAEHKKTFVGSANFSENGFFFQRELMTEVKSDFDKLFQEQKSISKNVLELDIEQYITFYDDSQDSSAEKDEELPEKTHLPRNVEREVLKDKQSRYIGRMKTLYSNADPRYFEKFSLSIVLPKEANGNWNRTGINAWTDGGIIELEETPKTSFNQLFPTEKQFKVYTDEGNAWVAKLDGRVNKRKLRFHNLNLHQFICSKIGINDLRPVSYDDLLEKGCTTLYFTRLSELEYVMSFEEISY